MAHTCSFLSCDDWVQMDHHMKHVVFASEAHSIQAGSLNSRQTNREKRLRGPSHLGCIFWSWLWDREMWTRVTQSHWNSRAVRPIYQIDPSLIWQKQHVLLFNEPIGVNTSQAAHELQWGSVYFARNRRRFFWRFSSEVQREKKLNHWMDLTQKEKKAVAWNQNTSLKNRSF